MVTCEHGGHRVPARHRALFAGAGAALRSHRGWDPGALELARDLARALEAPLLACTTTRLLVDANRSAAHPRLFSAWSRALPAAERAALLARWWRPHHAAVTQLVRAAVRRRRTVLHLSVHSFTPRWKGRPRAVDVGFLYDPTRRRERAFAAEWRRALAARRGDLALRRNQPYRGNADGLTSCMREAFDGAHYLGVELEVSQRFPLGPAPRWRRLRRDLVESLADVLHPDAAAGWLGDV
jgi:predicted N-formylglutamate amidohydrolase